MVFEWELKIVLSKLLNEADKNLNYENIMHRAGIHYSVH